jgi:branched-chain amino acid transport system ATP-binding protein
MTILEVRGLSKNFGALRAVDNVDFDIYEDEIVGLLGPNGAGKTTLFNVLTGFDQATSGKVSYKKEDILGLRPDQIAQKGIIRTFQQTLLALNSTVLDNIFLGFHMSGQAGVIREFFRTAAATQVERRVKQQAQEILEFIGLNQLQNELAGNLPHGHQRTLAIGMALASNPTLLLLDEPLTGMNPTEKATTMSHIGQIRDRGITIIMVEHDMKAVMNICERLIVLNYGRKIADGIPSEIRENQEVIEAYLGRGEG